MLRDRLTRAAGLPKSEESNPRQGFHLRKIGLYIRKISSAKFVFIWEIWSKESSQEVSILMIKIAVACVNVSMRTFFAKF